MEKFFCKVGNAYVIPNIYNQNSLQDIDCTYSYNKNQNICNQCVQCTVKTR